jgi:hypothetical protein
MRRASIPLLTLLFLIPWIGGCGDDSSPAAPEVAPDPSYDLYTYVTVSRVDVIKDGDGIEGQGEFWFYRQVGGTGYGWGDDVPSGGSSIVDWTKTMRYQDYDPEVPHSFEVMFQATEYDQNILGEVYADSDMDGRSATASYVMSPTLTETNYITLGNDKCKVRMHYSIRSELVENLD